MPATVFTILRDLIRDRVGLHYEEAKRDLLADKLSVRVVEKGFESFLDYYYLLKYGPGAEEEWPRLMDALSVPETFFWREMTQVQVLVDVLVPRYFASHPSATLRIWSAACASGEEPLTIAMALNEADWFDRGKVEIIASDASPAALTRAQAGVYRDRSFRALPASVREKYFTPHGPGEWRVSPELHARVRWCRANLQSADEVAPLAQVPVIFCRNVFIYFSVPAVTRTVGLFAAGITTPGYLFVGVSESLVRITCDFELQEIDGAFVYVRS
jgi:chemotaxis protein methyltransferase CheR